ncbi:hypothetical protein [Flavobacterium sp. ov086]|nr:hypothetical protein [Flavobacterium sp. ov086]
MESTFFRTTQISFSTSPDHKKQAEDFVLDYISSHDLEGTIILLSAVK